MPSREDLVFATCDQLAGYIKEELEEVDTESIRGCLVLLSLIRDPEEGITNYVNLLPEKIRPQFQAAISDEHRIIQLLALAKESLKFILPVFDKVKTENSEALKKEIMLRITNYEYEFKRRNTPPDIAKCRIEL